MPQPHRPDPPNKFVVQSPICPTCETPMILERTEPHERYSNLDEWVFTCPCGRTATKLIRRLD